MNEISKIIKIYKCDLCNKKYSSQSSLCNHNKKFHTNKINLKCVMNNSLNVPIITNNILQCKYCNKIYSNRHSKWKHNNICKDKINSNNELIDLKNENREIKKSLEELKELLINSKIHPKTLQKINKNLINNTTNNNTTNNNTTNNNTTNNNTTINNTINLVSLGSENLSDILNKKEKINILKDMYGSLSKLVKYVHFNDKFPQFKTMVITNMQNNIAYKYNEDENRFITITKNELLNDLISIRLDDIIAFNEEIGDKLDNHSKIKIDKFLEEIDDNDKLKEIKKSELKIILYNNRNIINMIK
jgi:hypothetical protein